MITEWTGFGYDLDFYVSNLRQYGGISEEEKNASYSKYYPELRYKMTLTDDHKLVFEEL